MPSRRSALVFFAVGSTLALCSAGESVVVTNMTTNIVVFNAAGFEYEAPGHEPLAILQKSSVPRLWETQPAPWDMVVSRMDRYIHPKPPASPDGLMYLKTTRDGVKSGHPVARFAAPQSTLGDLIRAEFSLQVPADVDAKIVLGHGGPGAHRGMLRIVKDQVMFHDGAAWHAVTPAMTVKPETWQTWVIDYEIGASTFSVSIDGGPARVADALESVDAKGSGGWSSLGFAHNREQSFLIDAAPGSRDAAATRDTLVQSSQDLPQMLRIDWSAGRDLPQGIQTPGIGVIDNTLIWVGGFCSGGTLYPNNAVPGKPAERYQRGFFQQAWSLHLGERSAEWRSLPPLPVSGRQSVVSAVVGKALYIFGGFNYDESATRDGYRLTRTGDDQGWRWEPMPELPWNLCFAGSAVDGDHIYILGGADNSREAGKSGVWMTATARDGSVPRLGARLLTLDTTRPEAGWRELPECPGTPRFMPATTAANGYIYVLGGITGLDNADKRAHVVVDNWRYHIESRTWERLQDLPVSASRHPSNQIIFDGRYVLLVGGHPTPTVMNPDGTTRPGYGLPYRATWGKSTFSDVTVYDLVTQTFGRANPLPITNNMPAAVVHNGRVYLVGGETETAVVDGVHYGHHPDLLLIGNISVVAR